MADIKRPPTEGITAGLRTDILSPKFYNFLYTITDSILNQQGGGGAYSLRLYDDIEQDAHAYAVLHKRKMAVIASPWGIEPASTQKKHLKQAEFVYECLEDAGIDKVCYDLLDAILKGYSASEIMWSLVGDKIKPVDIFVRDQRRFEFREDQDTGRPVLMLKDWEHQFPGIDVAKRKFLVHQWGAKDSNPHGLGIGNKLYWPVFFKKQVIALWQIYMEKFAIPTVMGEYEPSALQKNDRADLLQALQNLTQDAAVTFPKGTKIELLEPQRQGSMSPFERAVRWFDEQISEAVLGETLTTNAGRTGSHAAAQVHDDIRTQLSLLDMAMLNQTIQTQLIQWIMDYNYPGEDCPIYYRKLDDPADNKARSEVYVNIAKVGYYPTPERMMREFGDGLQQGPAAGFQDAIVQAGAPKKDASAADPSSYQIEPLGQPGRPGDAPPKPPPAPSNNRMPRPGSNSLGVMARPKG